MMNDEQSLALEHARLAVADNVATEMVKQLVSIIGDLETLDEERRRSLNEITTARDELRDQHAQCVAAGISDALHEVECPSCHATIRARMADAPRRRYPEGEAIDIPVTRTNYLQQADNAGRELAVLLERIRAAGFYVTEQRDEIHFDIDATPRDESRDPQWRWRQHPDTGSVQRVRVDNAGEQLDWAAARDEQPEFPDTEDEPPDRPVYETDPLKE